MQGLADRLGILLEELLDRLTAPEIAEWEAYLALLRDEDAFESKEERFKRTMRRILGDR